MGIYLLPRGINGRKGILVIDRIRMLTLSGQIGLESGLQDLALWSLPNSR